MTIGCIHICRICLDLHIWIWDVHLCLGNDAFILDFPLLHLLLFCIWILMIMCRLNILIWFLIVIFLPILLSVIYRDLISKFTSITNKSLIILLFSFSDFINILVIGSLILLILRKISFVCLNFNLKIWTWIMFLKIILRSVLRSDPLICVFIRWLININSEIVNSWY